jgi:RimJ/RimL family protein N-acetyltransferase
LPVGSASSRWSTASATPAVDPAPAGAWEACERPAPETLSGGLTVGLLALPRSDSNWHMLRGEKVALRARIESDVTVLHAELYDDVLTRSRTDSRAWRPISVDSAAAPFRIQEPTEDHITFSVVQLGDGDPLVGSAVLWGVDLHSRSAHIGMALLPEFRGRGLAVDTVRVLCDYGFTVRGLHRMGVETLSDNAAMLRTAERVGFVREGVLRQAAWVNGEFVDEVVFGMLVDEWHESQRRQGTDGAGAELSRLDELVDEGGRESFPASDPPAF